MIALALKWLSGNLLPLIGGAAAIAALLGGAWQSGRLSERADWQAVQVVAERAARAAEQDAAQLVNAAERRALADTEKRLEVSHAQIAELTLRLATMPRCPVSRAAVRVLDGAAAPVHVRDAAGSAARLKPPAGAVAAAAADTDTVDARAVLENCAWNRINVAERNARQVEALQDFYEALRQRLNRGSDND